MVCTVVIATNAQNSGRYQAEVLIYQHCPVSSLMGIICYTDEVKSQIESQLQHYGLELAVYVRPGWYFQ